MKALITGATGFIGSHLRRELQRSGWEVAALVRSAASAQALRDEGIQVLEGDLTAPSSLKGIGSGVDVVFHLAAQLNLHGVAASEYSKNSDGTRNLIDALRLSSISRFISVSSIAAIGIRNVHKIDESFPCSPDLPYGVSKLRADKVQLDAHRKDGFPAIILRPPTVYGPGERYNFLSLCRAIQSGRFLLIGDGRNRIDFCWVGNLVNALVLAAEKGSPGEVYFVADDPVLSFAETVTTIGSLVGRPVHPLRLPVSLAFAASLPLAAMGRLTGRSVPLNPKRVRTMVSDMCFDLSKIRTHLGFANSGTFSENAARTIEWYRDEGLLTA